MMQSLTTIKIENKQLNRTFNKVNSITPTKNSSKCNYLMNKLSHSVISVVKAIRISARITN